MSDDDLVEGLRSKNFIAQQEFLEDFAPKLSEYFLNSANDLTEAEIEDIVFNRLYYFITEPEKIDLSRGSLWGLLFVSVKNKVTDLQRLKGKAPKFTALENVGRKVSNQLVQENNEDDEDDSRPRLPAYVLSEAKKLIAELNLTESEDTHLRLRLEQGFESKEVAKYLGVAPNTESVRWNRLMSKISSHLDCYPVLIEYIQKQEQQTN